MKKLLVLGITVVLVFAVSLASLADVAVKFNGEGNFGYKFTEDNAEGDDGVNFGDFVLKTTADINENISLFSKIKTEYTAGKTTATGTVDGDTVTVESNSNQFFIDEMFATLKYDPVTMKIGYWGFGFGGDKDIIDAAMGDMKSQVGIQAETTLMEGLTAKVYYPSKGDRVAGDFWGGFGVGLDYSQDLYGVGFVYGKTEILNDDADKTTDDVTGYAVTGYYKPIADLKAFVDYSVKQVDKDTGDVDDTNIIIGALYTPVDLPIEFRAEYDVDNKNETDAEWTKDFNPWGVRVAYKLNDNTKIQLDRKQKNPSSQATELKLNVTF
jgi:hypothetical protein